MEQTYSTGEAAKRIGRSPQHCKLLARLNGVKVHRTTGRRADWVWTLADVLAVKKLVDAGVSK